MTKVSWIGGNGNWSDGADWSTGSEPGSGDTVLLQGSSAYTVTMDVADTVGAISMTDASAALQIVNALTVRSSFNLSAGFVGIDGGGTLSWGVFSIATTASAVLQGGTIANEKVEGGIFVANAGGDAVTGNVVFTGANGTGLGSFNFNGGNYYAQNYLEAVGNTVLDGAVMTIGNTGIGGSINILYAADPAHAGTTLTLGSNFEIYAPYGNSALQGQDGAGDRIINNGTIEAAGGALQIDATSFVNRGTMLATGGVLYFTGNIAASLINGVTLSGSGEVGVDGIVNGGTIVSPKGGVTSFGNSGVFDNVTFQGTLHLDDSNFIFEGNNRFSGAKGTGRATINYTDGNYYAANYVDAQDNTKLDNAILNIGNTGLGGSINILYASDTTGNGATFTMGTNFILNEVAGNSALQGADGAKDHIINQGTILATTGGGALGIDATSFQNKGRIYTATGGVVYFTGSMNAGLLDSVTLGAGGYLGVDGIVSGGTIVDPSGLIGSWDGSGAFDNVAVQGTFQFQDGGFVLEGNNRFSGANGSGRATLNYDQGNYYSANYIYANNTTGLDNAILNIGNTGLGGSINILYARDTTGNGAVFTLGANFVLNEVAGNSALQGSDGAADHIINEGTILATNAGGDLGIDATSFQNKGTIYSANGGVVYFTGAIGAGLLNSVSLGKGGYAGIDGVVNGGTIIDPNGQIGSFNSGGELINAGFQGTLTIGTGGMAVSGNVSGATIGGGGQGVINFDQGLAYGNAFLYADGNTTLNNAVLNIGNNSFGAVEFGLYLNDPGNAGATLTLGKNFEFNAITGRSSIGGSDGSNDKIVNLGTIAADTGGVAIYVDGTDFVNKGVIQAANGGVIAFSGTSSAALINSAVASNGGFVGIAGIVNGGTLISPNGEIGSYKFPTVASGELIGTDFEGTLTLTPGGYDNTASNIDAIEVTGTIAAVQGAGVINFDQSTVVENVALGCIGNTTLANATINIGNTGLGGSENYIYNQDAAGGATLTLASNFIVNATLGISGISSSNAAGDAVINDGTIEATGTNETMYISVNNFTNNGVIFASNGGTIDLNGTIVTGPLNGITLGTGGTLVIGEGASIALGAVHGSGEIELAANATLTISASSLPGATIAGFGAGDRIDLAGASITGLRWAQESAGGGALSLFGDGGVIGTLSLAGAFTAADFGIGGGGDQIMFVTAQSPAAPGAVDTSANAVAAGQDWAAPWHGTVVHF